VNAWELGSDGRYRRRRPRGKQVGFSAQQALMDMLGAESAPNKEIDNGTDPLAPR
jgi:polyphosphate kinase